MSRPIAAATVVLVGIATGRWRRPTPPARWDAETASARATTGPDAAAARIEVQADATSNERAAAVGSRSADISRAASMMARARWGRPANDDDDPHPAAPKLQFGPMVFSSVSVATATGQKPQFGPMVFGAPARPAEGRAPLPLSALPDTEFVPVRVDVDIDGLRSDLTGIAMDWLGAADAAPVAEAIAATPPGVDDFVLTIASIREMEILGRANPVVRAMTREMHYHATEVLCGV